MKELVHKIANLIDLKTIVTIAITASLVFGFVTKLIEGKDFMIIATMVFTFYFAKKENAEPKG